LLAEERRQRNSGRPDWRQIEGTIEYAFEAPRRVRAGFIGCGGHSYRNIYPTFRYAPVDLVAVADVVGERAEAYRREFGAQRAYSDYREMLEKEDLECVFVVTNYDEDGRPRFPGIAIDAMKAGVHVWIEKPPAASLAEVEAMIDAERATGKFVQVGYKKMFAPAYVKVQQIAQGEAFGGARQISIRYPQSMPPPDVRYDLAGTPQAIGFLDHVCHPLAILQLLGGDAESMTYVWEAGNGGFMTLFNMRSGAIASWHSSGGQGRSAPLEHVEVVGKSAHIVIDNTVRVIYYRQRPGFVYGRSASFLDDEEHAPIIWEPEFSLGNLNNDNAFFLGYVPQVRDFCENVMNNTRPLKAGMRDTWMQVQIYEAYRHPAGTLIELQQPPEI